MKIAFQCRGWETCLQHDGCYHGLKHYWMTSVDDVLDLAPCHKEREPECCQCIPVKKISIMKISDILIKVIGSADALTAERQITEVYGGSPEWVKAVVEALKSCRNELKELVNGEACDHSVGLCFCPTFLALESAEQSLA